MMFAAAPLLIALFAQNPPAQQPPQPPPPLPGLVAEVKSIYTAVHTNITKAVEQFPAARGRA